MNSVSGSSARSFLVLRLLCALVWAGELFWIQSLAFEVIPWLKHPVITEMIRFHFDLMFALAAVFLVRRRFLIPLVLANSVALIVIGAYVTHFHWPLMPVRVLSEWEEGWSMRSGLLSTLSLPVVGVVAVLCGIKTVLLLKSGRSVLPRNMRWRILGIALLAYGLPFLALQRTKLDLSTKSFGLGRTVFVYGYTLPWICDLMSSYDLQTHAVYAREYLAHHYDRITPVERPLPVPGNVVVLQLESVGTAALAADYAQSPVMPFLRELKEQSMFFRIQSFHRNGTCDMDYAATTGVEPYPRVVPYRLPGMEYTNAVPAFMKRFGYETFLYHGNTELFYDRGAALERLGFDHLFFKEQLAPQHLPTSTIGVRDAAILGCIAKVTQARQRAYVFGITLDTHAPFQELEASEMKLFPTPQNAVERYFNSLRYLDGCLRDFIERVPVGTTVVLYGDHTTSMHSDLFNSDVVDGKEFVGCLIYQKGRSLAGVQQSREQPVAMDGALNLLDVMSYLRHSIEVKATALAATETAKLH